MKADIERYYQDNGKYLKVIVNKILCKFGGISQKDYDDFYSVANEAFVKALKSYDPNKNFDAFIYSCLSRKIKTEITRRNRYKRKADLQTISLDGGNEDEQVNPEILGLSSDIDVFEEVSKHEYRSTKLVIYLGRLSKLQKKIVILLMENYKPYEIESILHITHNEYLDNMKSIRSYENVSVLF